MKKKSVHLFAVLLLLHLSGYLLAQNVIPAAGGQASGSGGTVGYTVGQAVYEYYQGSGGSITAGIQQIYSISVINSIDKGRPIQLRVEVYPNPATNYLILEVENCSLTPLSYQLYDLNGKLVEEGRIVDNKTTIGMSKYYPANFILKVVQGSKNIKSFTITKTK